MNRLKTRYIVFLTCLLLLIQSIHVIAQELVLLDYNDGLKPVNDQVITVSTNDLSTLELSAHLMIWNNTDRPLALFMRKIYNHVVDSTSDYFCLYPKCWPDTDTTDIADSIPAGLSDSSFVTHYDHYFRYEKPIPPGLTSITYVFFDYTTFEKPVEARVTINYHISGLGFTEKTVPDFKIYPVPATKVIVVDPGEFSHNQAEKYVIYDCRGKMLREFSAPDEHGKHSIDITDLRSGLYFLGITLSNGQRQTSRFVVSR